MLTIVLVFILLPVLIKCGGEGNIHLLEDEIAIAIKACIIPKDDASVVHKRQKRSENNMRETPRIDNNLRQEANPYGHQRRDPIEIEDKLESIPNLANYSIVVDNDKANKSLNNRTERSTTLTNKPDTDQCLSQCVFANLQAVDSQGIPREAELWKLVQSSVTSQQSRAALRDQIRACFQELQSEAEDNGCSYSNKLERCLMLRFSDRKVDDTNGSQKS